MKLIIVLLFFSILIGCTGCSKDENSGKTEILKKILIDDQVMTANDWGKEKISIKHFEAELKLGEIIKTVEARSRYNRFSESEPLSKRTQKIYLKEGEIITRKIDSNVTLKQRLQDKKRYDIFYIKESESGNLNEIIRIYEFTNDSIIKVLNYVSNPSKIVVYSNDPYVGLGQIFFDEENYSLYAKQKILINKFGKPKEIYWFHENQIKPPDQPTETFEYNEKGLLTKRTNSKSQEEFKYENGLLRKSTEKISGFFNEEKEPVFYTKEKEYEYIPNGLNWIKRIERVTSHYSDNEKSNFKEFFVLEKR